jgi:hypothetical protein
VRVAISVATAFSVLLSSTGAAAGAGPACALTIRAEGLDERWTRELDAIRAGFASRQDVDPCASLFLERAADGRARLVVVLKDGRSTERTLVDPVDLRSIVTALVLLPEQSIPPRTSETDETRADLTEAVGPTSPVPASVEASKRDYATSATESRPANGSRARLDLGGLGGARWSGAAPAGAVGVFADLRLGDWVLGAHGRWDGYTALSGLVDYTTQALEFGAELGHDVRLGATSLTVLAGPSFVALSQTLQSTPPSVYVSGLNPKTGTPIGTVTPFARQGQVLRLGGAIRWYVLSRPPVRLFASADAEFDASSDAGNRAPSALAATSLLPVWSAGLSLGGALAVWP